LEREAAELDDLLAQVLRLHAALNSVIEPAKRILARLHNEEDQIQGDDVLALESAIERAGR
jgi:hypothetical protein